MNLACLSVTMTPSVNIYHSQSQTYTMRELGGEVILNGTKLVVKICRKVKLRVYKNMTILQEMQLGNWAIIS